MFPSTEHCQLSQPAAEWLIHAFISSRLDYCNALFVGASAKCLNRLQYVQNCAARVLTHTSSREHFTVLLNIHWIPICSRILVYTYQAIHNSGPKYLSDLILPYCPTPFSFRSVPLQQPRSRHKTMRDWAFSCMAPRLCYLLPDTNRAAESLSSFKAHFKNVLFRRAFKNLC